MTETYNPIIGREEISGLRLFQPRPKPEPGVAIVLFKEGQPLFTLLPGDRLTAGEVRWGGYKVVYKIDVTEHSFDFKTKLPCSSDAFDFLADVGVTYSVEKADEVVKRNITNARSVLEPLITDTMRNISRQYDVEDSATAERTINEALKKKSYGVGLKLNRFVARLSLEDEARDYLRDLKKIDRDKEREKRAAELTLQRDQLEIERQKMKMDFYGPLIEKGQWQLLALQLSNHPEDVTTVMQFIREQRQDEINRQLEILKIMIEEDAIEGFQLQDTGKRVLQRLIDSLGSEYEPKTIGSPKERPALPKAEKKSSKQEPEINEEKETTKNNN